ncbi:MAG: Ribosomal large subunit pseudouridine synthase D [Verrucomicrobiae bacterium]|nr:Ribosomal large subunit pseudouridine synthase D [Verrucomicrobiae bacterium]
MTLTVSDAGERLDQFLVKELPAHSRAFLQKLITDAQVLVNGQPRKPSYKTQAGDSVSVAIPAPRALDNQPEAIALDVLYEDADLIVLNKPAGLVVHPAAGNFEHTLVNALLHHCRGQLAGIGGVERPGIVHRLDKGTSGCIVVAKTDPAHQGLVAQFKARGVCKIYRAVCAGKLARAEGRIETIIGRSERDRKKMSANVKRGRPAVTEYKLVKQHADCAVVELTLLTGRTHQIRVHMAHIGNPLVGDAVYGRAKKEIARPLLHAYKLGFTHPRTGKRLEFCAPIPDDMKCYE